MPIFICPNCGSWSPPAERTAGFSTAPRGCQKCGFGFLFELLDDYYPDPNAAFFVCDSEARVIGCGRGTFELTGLRDESAVGRPVKDILGLTFADGEDPIDTSLEWGVRVLGRSVRVQAEGDLPAGRRRTSSPPTTRMAACYSCSLRSADRQRVPRLESLGDKWPLACSQHTSMTRHTCAGS